MTIEISSIADLIAFSNGDYGRGSADDYLKVKLTKDLDFALDDGGIYRDINWQGCTGTWYIHFDGGGNTISNISYQGSEPWAFFRSAAEVSTIQNLTLKDINIFSTSNNVSGIINTTTNGNITVKNCHVSGRLESTGNNVGGIAGGSLIAGKFDHCTFSGVLIGGYWVGGIVGCWSNGAPNIYNCEVFADIKGASNTSGILSYDTLTSTIVVENCIFRGTINAPSGIICYRANGTMHVANCIAVLYGTSSSRPAMANGAAVVRNLVYDKTAADAAGITITGGDAATTEQLQSREWMRKKGFQT